MNAIANNAKGMVQEKEEVKELVLEGVPENNHESGMSKERKSVFELWSEKLKDFLDNAE